MPTPDILAFGFSNDSVHSLDVVRGILQRSEAGEPDELDELHVQANTAPSDRHSTYEYGQYTLGAAARAQYEDFARDSGQFEDIPASNYRPSRAEIEALRAREEEEDNIVLGLASTELSDETRAFVAEGGAADKVAADHLRKQGDYQTAAFLES